MISTAVLFLTQWYITKFHNFPFVKNHRCIWDSNQRDRYCSNGKHHPLPSTFASCRHLKTICTILDETEIVLLLWSCRNKQSVSVQNNFIRIELITYMTSPHFEGNCQQHCQGKHVAGRCKNMMCGPIR